MSAATVTPIATGAGSEQAARDAIVAAVLDVPGQRKPVTVTCRGGCAQAAGVLFFGGAPIVRASSSTPVLRQK